MDRTESPLPDVDALQIRRASDADWPRLWPIVSAVLRGGDTYLLEQETDEATARTYWMGGNTATYLAELEGVVVGTYLLRANQPGRGSHVANASYMVDPAQAGHGIGWRLGLHSLDEARAAGFTAMQFNAVVATNTRAIALWQRLGFAIVGTVPGAYRHSRLGFVDLLVMHRFL